MTISDLSVKLSPTKGVERQRIAAELSNWFKKYFSGSKLTEYEVGQALGVVMSRVLKKGGVIADKNFQTNEAIRRENLLKLNKSVSSDVLNITASRLKQLKEIAAIAKTPD